MAASLIANYVAGLGQRAPPRGVQGNRKRASAGKGDALGAAPERGQLLMSLAMDEASRAERAGVAAIYGPGSNIPAAASEMLQLIANKRLAA
jgi:hypothetical protein